MRVSEIRVNQIRVNQGLGVPQVELFLLFFGRIEDTKKTFRNKLTFGQLFIKVNHHQCDEIR